MTAEPPDDTGTSCPSSELLYQYAARKCQSNESDAIDAHLDSCEPCQSELDRLYGEIHIQDSRTTAFQAGDCLGDRYEIDRVLSVGGFSTAFLAKDQASGNTVVVKCQHLQYANTFPISEEEKLLHRLNHPCIVKSLGVIIHRGEELLVLQYVNGDHFSPHSHYPYDDAMRLIEQLADAVAECHDQNVLHLDLSPSNIIIDKTSQLPCIIDFGISAHRNAPDRLGVGTAGYMSPERLAGKQCDARADVWSLGVILYEMLTGKYPFPTPYDLDTDPESPASLNHTVPKPLSDLCLRCIAQRPRDRPDNARKLLKELRTIVAEQKPAPPVSIPAILVALALLVVGAIAFRNTLFELLYIPVAVPTELESRIDQIVREEFADFGETRWEDIDSYEDLLLAQNPQFTSALNSLNDAECGILLAYAPAGYGKTDMLERALQLHLPNRKVVQIEPRKYASEMKDDLILRGKVVNQLPMLSTVDISRLMIDVKNQPARSVVVLDGIDELHQDAFSMILKMARDVRGDLAEANSDVVMFMRPEVIDTAVKQDNRDNALVGVQTCGLNPQQIPREAIHLRVRNFLDYLARKEETQNSPRRDVIDKLRSDNTVQSVTRCMTQRINSNPFLVDALRGAMHSKLIIEACLDEGSELGDSESEIRNVFMTRACERNVVSHGRPNEMGTEYLAALTTIAAECTPDEKGFFRVPLELPFPDGNGDTFDPYQVLQRSGLVSLVPAKGNAKMRFEPVWIQAELAAMSRRRFVELSTTRLCAVVVVSFIVWAALCFLLDRVFSISNFRANHITT
jgi:serine/threonine protein kinase